MLKLGDIVRKKTDGSVNVKPHEEGYYRVAHFYGNGKMHLEHAFHYQQSDGTMVWQVPHHYGITRPIDDYELVATQ